MQKNHFKVSKWLKTVSNIGMLTGLILLFQNCAGQKQIGEGPALDPNQAKFEVVSGTITHALDGCGPSVCSDSSECYALSGDGAQDSSLSEGSRVQVAGKVSQKDDSGFNTCMGMVNKQIEVMDIQHL